MTKKSIIILIFALVSTINIYSTRRALLVGINDYLPDNNIEWRLKNLRGCINDVNLIKETIKQQRFGFSDDNIYILLNSDASRQNIILALENLACISENGDIVFFYYSGHGSQWKNSREPDGYDETIVPADGYYGTPDIRDVEIKKLLNNILAKGTILTVIMDCCHSGSGTRGLLPYDAVFRYADPIEKDLNEFDSEPAPSENPQALILAASHEEELAQERLDPELNNERHGVFTTAIIKAINTSYFNEPADKLFIRAKSIMEGWGYAQIPDIESQSERRNRTLFGEEVNNYNGLTMIPVIDLLSNNNVVLNGGILMGLTTGSELIKLNEKNELLVRLKVTDLFDLNKSTCEIIYGNISDIKSGDLVELDKRTYGGKPNIRIYIPSSAYNQSELIQIAKLLDKGNLVSNNNEDNPDYILYYDHEIWKLTNKNGKIENLGSRFTTLPKFTKEKKVFLNIPTSASVYQSLIKKIDENSSVELVQDPTAATYMLIGRYINGIIEYSWILQNMHQLDQVDDLSIPLKTDWVNVSINENNGINILFDYVLRLGRILAWNNLIDIQPKSTVCFPFKLSLRNLSTNEIINSGTVYNNEKYDIVLIKDTENTSCWNKTKRYIYVFSIDIQGKMNLLYPNTSKGIDKSMYPTNIDDEVIILSTIRITPPFGKDNYFAITSNTMIDNPESIFENEGVETRGEKGFSNNPLEVLLSGIGANTRGNKKEIPNSWSIEKVTIKSLNK